VKAVGEFLLLSATPPAPWPKDASTGLLGALVLVSDLSRSIALCRLNQLNR
jgi:hypothetical protein